jgi:hypothetical protein
VGAGTGAGATLSAVALGGITGFGCFFAGALETGAAFWFFSLRASGVLSDGVFSTGAEISGEATVLVPSAGVVCVSPPAGFEHAAMSTPAINNNDRVLIKLFMAHTPALTNS